MTTLTGDGGIYDAVRIDAGDPDGLVFVDAFLNRVLQKAVRRLNHKLGLSVTNRPKGVHGYKTLSVAPITYDITNNSISPDNDELADLITLMMEYIIKKGEVSALKRLNAVYGGPFSTDAQLDDISVKNADGVDVRMGSNRLATRARLFTLDLETIIDELNAAVKRFIYRQTGNYSKLVF